MISVEHEKSTDELFTLSRFEGDDRFRENAGSSALCFSGRQCLLCGEVIDPGITANRNSHREPMRNRVHPTGTR